MELKSDMSESAVPSLVSSISAFRRMDSVFVLMRDFLIPAYFSFSATILSLSAFISLNLLAREEQSASKECGPAPPESTRI